MAETGFYTAYTVIVDSANKQGRVDMRVSDVDAKAYVAAADSAARLLTKVGLLLTAVEDLQLHPTQNIYKRGLDYGFLELPFQKPAVDDFVYRSNKLKNDVATTNAGLPATNFFTIPAYDPALITMESNGVNVVISGLGITTEVQNLLNQVGDTWLSMYNTAGVIEEITLNDE
jgi:hypothetical protein